MFCFMIRKKSLLFLSAVSCLLSVPSFCSAHGGGGDIALYDRDDQVGVGFAVLDDNDINQVSFDPNDVVHQSILIPQPAIPSLPMVGSTEPGFDANEYELTPNASVTVELLPNGGLFESSLSYWNGLGEVNFQPAVNMSAGYTPLANVDGQGGYHDHPTFGLTPIGGEVPDGVYVAEMQVSVDGMLTSDPYYIVALVDQLILSDANPEDAATTLGERIRAYQSDPANNLPPTYGGKNFSFYIDAVNAVPEPASSWLAVLAMVGLLLRRRHS